MGLRGPHPGHPFGWFTDISGRLRPRFSNRKHDIRSRLNKRFHVRYRRLGFNSGAVLT